MVGSAAKVLAFVEQILESSQIDHHLPILRSLRPKAKKTKKLGLCSARFALPRFGNSNKIS